MKGGPIFALIFFVIGVLCLVAGVANYMKEEAFFATAEQATATITDYVPDPNPKVSDFCPVYEFTTKAGQTVSYVGDSCPSKPDPSKIGQHEQVYIDPKNPQSVETKGLLGSEGSGLILGASGCVFFPIIGLSPVLIAFFQKWSSAGNASRQQAAATTKARQWSAERAQSDTELSADAEARLAKLKQQEEELKREIEERRRGGQ